MIHALAPEVDGDSGIMFSIHRRNVLVLCDRPASGDVIPAVRFYRDVCESGDIVRRIGSEIDDVPDRSVCSLDAFPDVLDWFAVLPGTRGGGALAFLDRTGCIVPVVRLDRGNCDFRGADVRIAGNDERIDASRKIEIWIRYIVCAEPRYDSRPFVLEDLADLKRCKKIVSGKVSREV